MAIASNSGEFEKRRNRIQRLAVVRFFWGRCHISGSNRIIRGGSWNNNANNLQVGNVNSNNPDNENSYIGFRFCSTGV